MGFIYASTIIGNKCLKMSTCHFFFFCLISLSFFYSHKNYLHLFFILSCRLSFYCIIVPIFLLQNWEEIIFIAFLSQFWIALLNISFPTQFFMRISLWLLFIFWHMFRKLELWLCSYLLSTQYSQKEWMDNVIIFGLVSDLRTFL